MSPASAAWLVSWNEFGLMLVPLPLILIANLHDNLPLGDDGLQPLGRILGQSIWALLALVAAGTAILGLLYAQLNLLALLILSVTAALAASFVALPTRVAVARFLPIDPASAVHATALVLSTVLAGSQIASQLAADLVSELAKSANVLTPADIIVQEVPFALAAFLGVGIFIRRSLTGASRRLGLVTPYPSQVIFALAAAGIFLVVGNAMDTIGHQLTPGLAHKVDTANQHLFGHLTDPLGIATIALAAGICEEVLFRGALQPRLGIVWTSFVFATIHTQYGLSFDTLAVFVLASGLGLLRRYTNTTTSTICHVVYNGLVSISMIGIGGAWLFTAVVLEAMLVLAGLASVLTGRLGKTQTVP